MTTSVQVSPVEDDVAVATLIGEHDLATAPEVRRELASVVQSGKRLVVDLDTTTFVDSTIIGALIAAREQARTAGLGFAVLLGDDAAIGVRRIFEVAGLTTLLPVCASRQDAIDAARGT